MVRLLVINPNTSPHVSASIDAMVKEEAGRAPTAHTRTANFGVHYIPSRSARATAGHAVLDAAAGAIASGANPDAIILGCFGDPGLEALQEMTGVPVIGFAEAGLNAAAALDGPFLVATRGQVWREMLQDLVRKLNLQDRVSGIHSINEENDVGAIAQSLAADAQEHGAKRIVVGGAGLIPILPGIAKACTLPILDPHRAAVRKAIRMAQDAQRMTATRFRERTKGLSEPLSRVFSDPELALPLAGNTH